MNKNIIISLAALVIFIVVGILIFYNKYNKNEEPQLNPINNSFNTIQTTKMNKNGVQIEILKEGVGVESKVGNMVTVNYAGTLINGVKFDSSYDRGVPFEFTLGESRVIPGWEIGVLGMKVGEKRKLTIPSELAYGATGAGNTIPPNSTLIFEVELLGI